MTRARLINQPDRRIDQSQLLLVSVYKSEDEFILATLLDRDLKKKKKNLQEPHQKYLFMVWVV